MYSAVYAFKLRHTMIADGKIAIPHIGAQTGAQIYCCIREPMKNRSQIIQS